MRALDHQLARGHVALIRGLHSLRGAHAEAVQTALATRAPTWVVEGHDDYDGDMLLIITASDQPEAPAYVLSSTEEGIHLALVGEEGWQPLACVDTLATAIDLLLHRLNAAPSPQATHLYGRPA